MFLKWTVLLLLITNGVFAHAETPFSISCLVKPHYAANCHDLSLSATRAYDFVTARIPDSANRKNQPIKIEVTNLPVVGRTVRRGDQEIIQMSSELHSVAAFQIGLVHEITHLIRHQYQPNEELWLDEALAEFMGILFANGRPLVHEDRIRNSRQVFLSQNSADYEKGNLGYANAYYFMFYLYGHLGNDRFLGELGISKNKGWSAVTSAAESLLSQGKIGIPKKYLTRNSLFTHYALAAVFNASYAAKYNLLSLNSKIEPLLSFSDPIIEQPQQSTESAFVITYSDVDSYLDSPCTLYKSTGTSPIEISVIRSQKEAQVDTKILAVCI